MLILSYVHVSLLCPQQKISIPRSENSSELQTFTFYLSNVGRDNPQGSFDCIQQYITRWRQTLHLSQFPLSFVSWQLIILFQETQIHKLYWHIYINSWWAFESWPYCLWAHKVTVQRPFTHSAFTWKPNYSVSPTMIGFLRCMYTP